MFLLKEDYVDQQLRYMAYERSILNVSSLTKSTMDVECLWNQIFFSFEEAISTVLPK